MSVPSQIPVSDVPLFPLNSLVLPGGRIPLQLFEPRYIDMLTACLKKQQGFVIVLLREGMETGPRTRFYDVGTYVDIVDFQTLDNGLLGISVEGRQKVAVHHSWTQPDGLNRGDLELLEEEDGSVVPAEFAELTSVLRALLRHPVVRELDMRVNFEQAREVGWRLTELLPLDRQEKQRLAELQEPLERLIRLDELIKAME